MPNNYCVFCSSSDAIAPEFFDAATELGQSIGRKKGTLIYGGASVGLMGTVAQAVHRNGGRVVGVSLELESFKKVEIPSDVADEMIITQTMRERKAIMAARADAFIALPGGFGTLDEVLEILTLKQLHFHQKPVVLINTNNFYTPLVALFEQLIAQKFAKPGHQKLYHLAVDAGSAMTYLQNYKPLELKNKWFAPATDLAEGE